MLVVVVKSLYHVEKRFYRANIPIFSDLTNLTTIFLLMLPYFIEQNGACGCLQAQNPIVTPRKIFIKKLLKTTDANLMQKHTITRLFIEKLVVTL